MDKTKFLLSLASILVGLGLILIFTSRDLTKTRLIFCDVGQGDGILITRGVKQVLIDGGPGTKIVDCLGQTMPFWDRTIELVVLTHPQRDHLEGLIEVLGRYKVGMIMTTNVSNETAVFDAWEEAVKAERARIYVPEVGDQVVINRGSTPSGVEPLSLQILWPERDQIAIWKQNPPSDLNETSIVMRLDWNDPSTRSARSGLVSCAYLTGDIPKEILQGLVGHQCEILKISHHGSKTGTNGEIIDRVNPKVAIIQVGKNSFGHPHKEVIDLLNSRGIKILRNDLNGIIEVESDGGKLKIKVERENKVDN